MTFDDQTTFSLSPNTRIVIDDFVYQDGGSANAASINVAVGTAAFVASLVAKTGDMKISTPSATLGIRGTTGVVEVPSGGAGAAPTIKLYPVADGHVGQIEVFDRQGGRLGTLTRGASAFSLRAGPGGRLAAVPYLDFAARGRARPRGAAALVGLAHDRPAHDHPAGAHARRQSVGAEWAGTQRAGDQNGPKGNQATGSPSTGSRSTSSASTSSASTSDANDATTVQPRSASGRAAAWWRTTRRRAARPQRSRAAAVVAAAGEASGTRA